MATRTLTVGEVAKRFGVSWKVVRFFDSPLSRCRRGVGYDADSIDRLWTRTQVARYLGKSKTTVRNMEGKVLDPIVVGPGGVHLFDRDDVELLSGKRLGRAAQSPWFIKYRGNRAHKRRPSGESSTDNLQSSPAAGLGTTPGITESLRRENAELLLQLQQARQENAELREILDGILANL